MKIRLLVVTYSIHAWFQLKFPFRLKNRRRVDKVYKKKGFLQKILLNQEEEEEPHIFENMASCEDQSSNGHTILVTGGAGYIGTHCIIELLQKDYKVVAIDNFSNAIQGENGK